MNKWHRAAGGWFGQQSEPGSFTLFWNWNLLNWTFGVSLDNDPCWWEIAFHIGPLILSFDYWRNVPIDESE